MMDSIAILDFGSQYAQLIARRLRELHLYCELFPWDAEAADLFVNLRRQGLRIGTMDLKIACVALAHDATLLSRNTTDFTEVPGLRFENWLG